jgi:hypothetical protein
MLSTPTLCHPLLFLRAINALIFDVVVLNKSPIILLCDALPFLIAVLSTFYLKLCVNYSPLCPLGIN